MLINFDRSTRKLTVEVTLPEVPTPPKVDPTTGLTVLDAKGKPKAFHTYISTGFLTLGDAVMTFTDGSYPLKVSLLAGITKK